MIDVFMGDKHRIDRLQIDAMPVKPFLNPRRRDAGIDEQTRPVELDVHGVSLAPACQYGYLQSTAPLSRS